MKSTSEAIKTLVEAFVEEIETLIHTQLVNSLTAAVSGGQKPSKADKSAVVKPAKKGGKRSPADLEKLTDKLHSYIGKHPGQRIEQIGAAMSMSTKDLRLPAQKLIADKAISTKGAKRATAYFAKV